jgi:hypothetical protein
MHVPLLARTCLPTFYLYRRTIFLSHKIKHVKIIRVKFKTLSLHYLLKIVLQSFVKTSTRLFCFRDIRAILQPQGYRLHVLQPQHMLVHYILSKKWRPLRLSEHPRMLRYYSWESLLYICWCVCVRLFVCLFAHLLLSLFITHKKC